MCDAVLSRGSPRQGEGSPLCGSVTLPTDEINLYMTPAYSTPVVWYKPVKFILFGAKNHNHCLP